MGCSPAGNLRHKITVESQSRASDSQGGATITWATFLTARAEIKAVNARERMFAGKREENITHTMRMRYRAGVTAEMRVSFDSRIFHIHGVINDLERNRWLILNVEEGVAS